MYPSEDYYEYEKKLNGFQVLLIIVGVVALLLLAWLKF
jgi:hypothetical protein